MEYHTLEMRAASFDFHDSIGFQVIARDHDGRRCGFSAPVTMLPWTTQ
jgi:hypothetical protein